MTTHRSPTWSAPPTPCILPYDSTEQVTSGVLTEAVAAGKPVIATTFPHAREQLSDGGGILVAHADPAGIAARACAR